MVRLVLKEQSSNRTNKCTTWLISFPLLRLGGLKIKPCSDGNGILTSTNACYHFSKSMNYHTNNTHRCFFFRGEWERGQLDLMQRRPWQLPVLQWKVATKGHGMSSYNTQKLGSVRCVMRIAWSELAQGQKNLIMIERPCQAMWLLPLSQN